MCPLTMDIGMFYWNSRLWELPAPLFSLPRECCHIYTIEIIVDEFAHPIQGDIFAPTSMDVHCPVVHYVMCNMCRQPSIGTY